MKPLILLLVVFAIALGVIKLWSGDFDFVLAGNIAMAAMLVFTAVGHFAFSKGMVLMIPNFIPYKTAVVYLTGVIELAAAIGLLIPSLRVLTGWLLTLFFIAILPANINAAMKKVDFQKANHDGDGTNYLWFRVPLQIFFIAWVYFSAIRN